MRENQDAVWAEQHQCARWSELLVAYMVPWGVEAHEGYSGEESRSAVTDGCSPTASRARSFAFLRFHMRRARGG
jgi:hypothetical protein